jgi:hypothetical protein
MRILIVAAMLAGSAAAARAADSVVPLVPDLSGRTVTCTAFRHDADGSWTTLTSVPVQRENEFTTVAAGTTLKPGSPPIAGLDVVAMLDRVCPH